MTLEKSVRFQQETDVHILFSFIENFYQIYKKERLFGIDHVVIIGKYLFKHDKIITVKIPYFIYKLAPTKFVNAKRIKINTQRLKFKRKQYQLTLNRPDFNRYKTLTNSNLVINKRKFAFLFTPNFIHSMDAMMPKIGMHKFMHITNKLKNNDPKSLKGSNFMFDLTPIILTYKNNSESGRIE